MSGGNNSISYLFSSAVFFAVDVVIAKINSLEPLFKGTVGTEEQEAQRNNRHRGTEEQ